MPGKIKFAIVGCGRIAQRHAAHIKSRGLLAAVCDIKKERSDALAAAYEAHAYYSIDDLLANEKELDVVAVCTPNGLHAQHAVRALNAGCHVLCEKPMALTTQSARAMITAAESNHRLLFVVKQNRFNPPVVELKKLLQEGRLGKIYSFQLSCFWNRSRDYYEDWRGTLALDGGTLFTQFSHFIDLLYWMLGDVKKASAVMANYAHQNSISFEDTGMAILELSSGAIGTLNYTVNSYEKNMEGSLTVFGEKGTVKIGGQYLNELDYEAIEGYRIPALAAGNVANQYGTYEGSMSNHNRVYDNLVDVLKYNTPISAGSLDGLKTVEIIEKIYSAAIRL